MRAIRRKINKIEKFLFWYKVIKQDEDWDYEYLIDIIDKKLERMIHIQLYDGNSMYNKKYAYQMARVRAIIQEYRDNVSYNNEQDYMDKIFDAIKKDILRWWD